MGFVDDHTDLAASLTNSLSSDEESAISTLTPLVPHRNGNGNGNSPSIPRTPTAKNNDLLRSTRLLRKRGMMGATEADEIWGELVEDAPFANNPDISSPLSLNTSRSRTWYSSQRRASVKSTRTQTPLQDNGDADGVANGEAPDEHTALLARSGTGRTYRDRRRRRSAPLERADFPGGRSEGARTQRDPESWWRRLWRGGVAEDPSREQR